MKKLVLIDGNAMLHRAFHALPPLTNKKGIIVNAVYGFFSMFLKILEDQKPEYLVVCFDRKAPTFRKELFVGYQVKRPKMSDDLVSQIKFVHDILEKAKVVIFEVDGYEADDLIGTIARQAVQKTQNTQTARASDNQQIRKSDRTDSLDYRSTEFSEMDVIIVSGDRDLLQLVNSHVKMIAPVTGLTNMVVYDEAKVEEKYGIKPSQIIDYKSLVGDASDNYPGVAGIGPKTARDLLQKYETFENLYQNLSSLPEKIGKKLATDAEQAALAKKLATIVTDAPIKLDLKECAMDKFSMEGARSAFEELGFKSLVKRLEGKGSEETKRRDEIEKKEKKQEVTQMELL